METDYVCWPRGVNEDASAKNMPYLDFLEQALEAESPAKHTRNVRLKTQWTRFPYNKGLDQFDFDFQPSVDERKLRELAGLAFLERKENVLLLGPPGVGKTHLAIALDTEASRPATPGVRSRWCGRLVSPCTSDAARSTTPWQLEDRARRD
jgi:DNA replication protein DnaC